MLSTKTRSLFSREAFRYRCSANQERYILASKAGPNHYALPVSYLLPAEVDPHRLVESIHRVVAASDALNVTLSRDEDGGFWCHRQVKSRAEVRQIKVAQGDSQAAAADLEQFVYSDEDILEAPLCRFHLARFPGGGGYFSFSLHHIVADAMSIGLFMERLSRAYAEQAETDNDDAAYPRLIQEHGLAMGGWSDEDEAYWRDAFKGAGPGSGLRAEMALDDASTRDAVLSSLSRDEFDRLSEAARACGVTRFEMVFTAYLLVLQRQTGDGHVCATFQSAGRRGLPESEGVIGQFSNALPIGLSIDPDQSLRETANRLRTAVRGALSHERYPYHQIIRTTGVHCRFGINWYPQSPGLSLAGLPIEPALLVRWQSDYDINLHCRQLDTGLELDASYPAAKYSSARIDAVIEQIRRTLIRLPDLLDQPVGELLALTRVAVPALAETSDAAPAELPSVYDAFQQAAQAHTDRVAITYPDGSLSYGQLQSAVDDLAERFVRAGLGKSSRVALLLPRGVALPIAKLAALKIGSIFAVFNPDYPAHQLSKMAAVFHPEAVVALAGFDFEGMNLLMDEGTDAGIAGGPEVTIRIVDRQDGPAPDCGADAVDAQYALFTSGTTGLPRCVFVNQRALMGFLAWHSQEHGFDHASVFALTGGIGHDPSLRDIFTPLTLGATLHIPDESIFANPSAFWAWMDEHRVSVFHATPQMMRVLLFGQPTGQTLDHLRRIFSGGDRLRSKDLRPMFAAAPSAEVWNFYGSTETPQAAAACRIDPGDDWSVCPINQGVAGMRVWVEGTDGRPAGVGELGEIIVAGPRLAEGFLAGDDRGLVPIRTGPSGRYRSGDLGFTLPGGKLVYVGRKDAQVKVRGYRVETADVAASVGAVSGVTQAVVRAHRREDGENELVAYYTVDPSDAIDPTALRGAVAKSVPGFMVPSHFVVVPRIPLTRNGKVDHAALEALRTGPAVDTASASASAYVPTTETEKQFVEIIHRILSIKDVDLNRPFAELGADSLSFLDATISFEKVIGVLPQGWENLPLRELSGQEARRSLWSSVETPVVMRAFAIVAVVLSHFDAIEIFGGGVKALFLIAGHSFGRFQVPTVLSKSSTWPITKLALAVAIPTILYTIFLQVYFGVFYLPNLLLYSNLITPKTPPSPKWFVYAYIQCLIIMAIPLGFRKVRDYIALFPFRAALIGLGLSYALLMMSAAAWNTDHLYDRVPQHALWIIAMGWCLSQAKAVRDYLVLAGIMAVLLVADYYLFDGQMREYVTLIITFVLMILVSRIRIPKLIGKIVQHVAVASLFIYLIHTEVMSFIENLNLSEYRLFCGVLAVLLGVVSYHAYMWIIRRTPLRGIV